MTAWKRRLVSAAARRIATLRAQSRDLTGRRRAVLQTVGAESAAVTEEGERTLDSLADIHRRAKTTMRQRHVEQLRHQADRVHRLAALHSGGAAGYPWNIWESDADHYPATAPLYRVGHLNGPHRLPALVELLDRSHLSLAPDAIPALPGLLLRAIGSAKPGDVRIHIYDPDSLGQTLAAFAPLTRSGLLRFIGPAGLRDTLDELVEHVRRVNADVLGGEYQSLAELTAHNGTGPEPRHLLVLHKAGIHGWNEHDDAQLKRLQRTGIPAGVTLLIAGESLEGTPVLDSTSYSSLPKAALTLDAPPPTQLITDTARTVGERYDSGDELHLNDLLPRDYGTKQSTHGLSVPIGRRRDGSIAALTLGDNPPHALIGGPSGSGKTNLIYTWIAGLTTGYDPSELEMHLLDFKEGVSFARYAEGRRDRTWLPHAKLVGININDDREFGLALLRHLKEELRRRADAAKHHEATKLSELRAADPGNTWPRIVAVIDEFQILLENRDSVTDEAVALLDDLARRGRSQGIHLILASQDVAGIEALWGRPSLVAQFSLRIALPKARRVLADNNHAADTLPKHHAIINSESGQNDANHVIALPNAGANDTWQPIQEQLWNQHPHSGPPRLFDGEDTPRLPTAPPPKQHVYVGQTIDVRQRPATFDLRRSPGRNLAVIGTRTADAHDLIATTALHLRDATVNICSCDIDSDSHAMRLAETLENHGTTVAWYEQLHDLVNERHRRPATTTVNLLYAVDAISTRLDHRDREAFRTLLVDGPENHVHTVGWWRSVPRLRDDLGGYNPRFDAIDAWVALDCHGNDLAPLTPGNHTPQWYPRTRRALYFDRAHDREPGVIIPYDPHEQLHEAPASPLIEVTHAQ
ncbi:FtsK/SpoIIIE domain-containing protein [Haloglycomyces albus]|uniref:FtsK/SpoIIIE domain-containing protein n=1 Tax=Haloglycomyces albus TaxID=526067 RepID=UPI00046D4608|nr:FtsK/SpoIIIE domain-containing protein [Haloglycomyces albus]